MDARKFGLLIDIKKIKDFEDELRALKKLLRKKWEAIRIILIYRVL